MNIAESAADGVLYTIAERGGMGEDDRIIEVQEILFEGWESGVPTMEFWTRFLIEDLEHQTYLVHVPGRLGHLIEKTVREHAPAIIKDELLTDDA